MRACGAGLALGAFTALLVASTTLASPPITEPARPAPADASAETSTERAARAAAREGFATTTTGVLTGLGFGALAIPTGSSSILLAGLAVSGAVVVAGPSLGWAEAGYPRRAALSALARLVVLGSAVALPLADAQARHSDLGSAAITAGLLGGVTVASVEAWLECGTIVPYVREHGPGRRWTVQLAPTAGPSGAPGLAFVARRR